MSTSYRQAALQVAYDPNWGRQSAIGVPRNLADLSARMNVLTRRHLTRSQKVEEVLDCSGRYKIGEKILSRIARLSLELDATARDLGGLMAAALGVAATPSGVAANAEVQTVTITGTPTSGTFRLQFNYETTAPIAYNAIGATVQAALEALSGVGTGQFTVAGGAGGPYTVTAAGTFVNTDIPQIIPTNISFGGGSSPTVTVTTDTEGGPARNTHVITELSTGYQKAVFTFVVGFVGADPIVLSDAALDSLTVTAKVGERIRVRADFIGRGDFVKATGFTFPACVNATPLSLTDGYFKLAGTNRMNLVRQLELVYQNKLLADTDPFTGTSIDPTRMETADRVESRLGVIAEGTIGDTTLWALANANIGLGTSLAARWRIGGATNGVEIVIPEGVLKAEDDAQGFDGEANRAVLNLLVDPRNTDNAAGKPINAIATNGQTTAYLLPG